MRRTVERNAEAKRRSPLTEFVWRTDYAPASEWKGIHLYAQRSLSDPGGRLAFCGVAVDYTLG
jgi:hypothetical protein